MLSNDSDLDGDAISITAINGTALVGGVQSIAVTNGTVNIDASDNITFSADANYNGPVSFDYTISDGSLTDTATVSGSISAVNDAPDAVDDVGTLDGAEDSTTASLNATMLSNDSDLDGDAISITAINGTALVGGVQSIAVANGTVNIDASDNITFSADTNYNGAVSFDYTISDGSLTDTATVNGTISAVNDAPDAVDDVGALDGAEDSTTASLNATMLSNDSDLDGDAISITAINGTALVGGVQSIAVTNGTVNIDAGDNITFTADANYNGAVSFDYTISDGSLTDTATVNGTISAVNDAPDAVDDIGALDGAEDSTTGSLNATMLSNDSDLDGDAISITAINGTALVGGVQSIAVTNGTVNIDASDNITFSADANYNGAVSFDYTISDGSLTDTATVNGTISAVNDAPDAVDDVGALDGTEDSTTASLNVTMLSNDSDLDGDAISITAINGTALVGGIQSIAVTNGTVNIDAGDNITFSADANYNGPVSFDYTLSDGSLTDAATVNGTISAVNDAPDAVDDIGALDGAEDSTTASLNATMLSNDSDLDGDAISITAINGTALVGGVQSIAVANGTVNIDASDNITFSSDANYNGAVSFDYTLSDGSLTDTATVNGAISAVNDAPDAVDDVGALDGAEDSTSGVLNATMLSNDSDLDGDAISITAINGTALVGGVQSIAVANGTVNIDAGDNITFSADANYNGAVSFDYTISDGSLTDTATVSGSISAVNDAPDAVDDVGALDGAEDSTSAVLNATMLSNDSDLDGDAISITAINGTALVGGVQSIAVANGTVNIDASDNITFSSDANYNGAVSFDYTISDGSLTDTATVNGTITPVNDAPVAVIDTGATDQDNVLNVPVGSGVLTNDTDLDGDTLIVSEVNGVPANVGIQIALLSGALLTLNADGSYDYDPNGVFDNLPDGVTTTDSFDYTVSDGNGGTDFATVTITLTGTNDAATITVTAADTAVTEDDLANQTANGTVGVTDVDTGEDSLSSSTATYGTVVVDGSGNWTYTLDNTNGLMVPP